jgi:hypothetical protein
MVSARYLDWKWGCFSESSQSMQSLFLFCFGVSFTPSLHEYSSQTVLKDDNTQNQIVYKMVHGLTILYNRNLPHKYLSDAMNLLYTKAYLSQHCLVLITMKFTCISKTQTLKVHNLPHMYLVCKTAEVDSSDSKYTNIYIYILLWTHK